MLQKVHILAIILFFEIGFNQVSSGDNAIGGQTNLRSLQACCLIILSKIIAMKIIKLDNVNLILTH